MEDSESYSDGSNDRSLESDEETDTEDEVVEIPSKGFKVRASGLGRNDHILRKCQLLATTPEESKRRTEKTVIEAQ